MNRKTIYIAGPMAGFPDNNAKAFYAACDKLRADGWMPINPVAFDGVFGRDPQGALLGAVCEAERAAIPFFDAIYLLKGWEKSKGAKAELRVALEHDLIVLVEGESDAS